MLLDQLTQVAGVLRTSLADLDPETLSGADAVKVLDAYAEVERLGSAGKLLAARRVESSKVWRRAGHRSAAAHVAEATGTALGPAIQTLETARNLGSLPATDEAVRQGRLSEAQVKEIAGAAILQPDAEQSLVDAAGKQPLNVLKLRCRRVKAARQDQGATYEAIRKSRYLRNWTEDNGAVRVDARLTADEGARLLAAVDAEAERLATAARRAGLAEPRKAYAADALVGLSTGQAPGGAEGPVATVHVRVDHAALVRGHVEPGELCEVPGIGPIPVEVARRMAVDSVLNVLVTDGVDVTTVAHSGRTIPASLRRALAERDPVCVVPGCDTGHHLEIDHVRPFAEGGPASLANLARLCHWHHYLKTHHGHVLERGEADTPDGPDWRWITPEEPPVVPRHVLRSG